MKCDKNYKVSPLKRISTAVCCYKKSEQASQCIPKTFPFFTFTCVLFLLLVLFKVINTHLSIFCTSYRLSIFYEVKDHICGNIPFTQQKKILQ